MRTLEARARLVHFFEATVKTARCEDRTNAPGSFMRTSLSKLASKRKTGAPVIENLGRTAALLVLSYLGRSRS